MNKHAVLIIAHKQFELLNMILRSLDSEYNDFYIHIDRKTGHFDAEEIKKGVKESSVYFVKRLPVTWGGYSLIRAELELLTSATGKGYSYYHLISGQDFPLKNKQTIYHFFENSGGKQYISITDCKEVFLDRIRYYHLFQERRGRKSTGIWNTLYKLSLKVQRKLRVNRLSATDAIYFGSQWFSITHELASFICSRKREIRKQFSFGVAADEMFLQTVTMNSGMEWNVAVPSAADNYSSCMRLVDWSRGDPYVFGIQDYDQLISSDKMFARKFDLDVDKEICTKLFDFVNK